MHNRAFGKNLIMVAFSRLVSLASGVVVGFLLPKALTVSDYGFYKTFTLYAAYTALLHFGFVDGILLKFAGKTYEELDARRVRAYTRFFIAFESIISALMIIAAIIFARGEALFIVIMLAFNMVFVNVTTYYQFISQAVQRFREYSAKNLIVSVVKILLVAVIFLVDYYNPAAISYRIYLIFLNIIDFSIMGWYILLYKNITFGKRERRSVVRDEIKSVFKTGIVLTLAYQVSHLILALDRQFVNLLFSTETFAVYSFAYNIVTLISTMISSISVVLLPMLKKKSEEKIIESYEKCIFTVAAASAVGLICYFPLASFIEWFLPDYSGSVEYISIVLAAFVFSAVISVVMFTIAKVLDMNLAFFKDSCFVLLAGVAANAAAYLIFRSPKAISFASVAVMAMWFVISGERLKKKTGVGIFRELCFLLSVVVGFLLIATFVEGKITGMLLYACLLTALILAFYITEIKHKVSEILKKSSE